MKKRMLALLAALLTAFVLTVTPVFALNLLTSGSRLADGADLLTSEEEAKLTATLDSVSAKHNVDVAVVTVNGTDGKNIQDFADDTYDNGGFSEDGIILAVDMESQSYHVSTSGSCISAFTDYGLQLMDGYYVPKLSSGQFYEAFDSFAAACDEYLTQYENGTPIDVSAEQEEALPQEPARTVPSAGTAGLAGALGLLVGMIRTGRMKSQLKTVRRQASAASYVKNGSMNVRVGRDDFLYRNVTRVEKPRNEDRGHSGGSTTHVSSSGHTHGGHGGHF